MPKPKKGPRLGSGPAHQRLMLNGIAAQLLKLGNRGVGSIQVHVEVSEREGCAP